MCKKCLEAVKREYPALDTKESMELLWEVTCYPFGTPEQVEKQLSDLKKNTDVSLALADEETIAAAAMEGKA